MASYKTPKPNYMHARIFVYSLLCGLFHFAHAQDSLPRFAVPTPQEWQLHHQIMASPLGICLLPAASYGYTAVTFNHERGSLARLQTPETESNVRLNSMGLYAVKRWRLYGEFDYRRQMADSVAWLLSETPRNGMPYYFASPRKGNWNNETYQLKGAACYHLSRLFDIGAALKITYHKGARSNDPRPATESFRSRYHLNIGLNLAPIHIAVGAAWLYGTSDNSIIYINESNDRIDRLDFMAYELMGFGMHRKTGKLQNREMQANTYGHELDLQALFTHNETKIWARATYLSQRDSIRRSRTKNVDANLLSTYNVRQTLISGGFNHNFPSALSLQATTYAHFTKGWDRLDNILGGQKNYVYYHRDMGLHALLYHRFTSQRLDLFALDATAEHEKRQDGATQHHFLLDAFTLAAAYRSQRPLPRAFALFYGASQAFTLSKASLSYPPTQETVFSTQLAQPLQHFHNTPTACSRVEIGAAKRLASYQLTLTLGYQLAYILRQEPTISGTRQHFEAAVGLAF